LIDHPARYQFGGKENEHGAHLLAFSVYDVVCNSVEESYFRGHGIVELLFKKFHFRINGFLYLGYNLYHCRYPDKIAGKFGFFGLVKLIKIKDNKVRGQSYEFGVMSYEFWCWRLKQFRIMN